MKRLLYRIALPVYWVVLAIATHKPHITIPTRFSYGDKVIHLLAFATLTLFYWRFVEALGKRPRVWSVAVVMYTYAAIDEYTQQFFHRTTDIWDYTANAIGISLMLSALTLLRRTTTSSSQS